MRRGVFMSSTYLPTAEDLKRKWFVIDAKDRVLGRLAVAAATVLTGKRKPTYTPFLDTGDHVIVVNAAHVQLTGKKEEGKLYRHHTRYLGHLKSATASALRSKRPTRLIEEAVRGMLPKTKLGKAMFQKLKVYAGPTHPHQAQRPQPLVVK